MDKLYKPARRPTAKEIRHMREKYGLTQTQAAKLVYCGLGAWQQWEAPAHQTKSRSMHRAFWELFKMRARWNKVRQDRIDGVVDFDPTNPET